MSRQTSQAGLKEFPLTRLCVSAMIVLQVLRWYLFFFFFLLPYSSEFSVLNCANRTVLKFTALPNIPGSLAL